MKYGVYRTTGDAWYPLTKAGEIDARSPEHALTVAKRKGFPCPIVEDEEHRAKREQEQKQWH